MKNLSIILILMMLLSLVTGCSNEMKNNDVSNNILPPKTDETKETKKVKVAGLKGPTSMGMIKLIDEKALNDENYEVEYIVENTPDTLGPKIINGDIQIAAVPINLASVLYNKTKGNVQFLALNTVGNLYIIGTDEISTLKDLEGKTLGISGKGAIPDYAMNYLLNENGLGGKVELDYVDNHTTLSQKIIAGDTTIAMLPYPFVTQVMMKNENIKVLIDLNKEWDTISQGTSQLATGCIVVNKEFAANNKEFIQEFLKQYEESVSWVNENPSEAGKLVDKNGIIENATLVEKAIPYCGITFKKAQESKELINGFYQILFNSNPASIGGSLPDEDFYYSE